MTNDSMASSLTDLIGNKERAKADYNLTHIGCSVRLVTLRLAPQMEGQITLHAD